MVYEPKKKQLMAWMEADYSKYTHFRWKIKWRLEHLSMLGIMGRTVPLTSPQMKNIILTVSNNYYSRLKTLYYVYAKEKEH